MNRFDLVYSLVIVVVVINERRTIVTLGLVKALAASGDGVFLAAAIDEQVLLGL